MPSPPSEGQRSRECRPYDITPREIDNSAKPRRHRWKVAWTLA
jgi:hypothetical protein